MDLLWDVAVVGAGPAGSSAALGALRARPGARVLLLDRACFPRDKACGDGVAPHALALLADVGVAGLLDDRLPVSRLRLSRDGTSVARDMRGAAWVVPREVFDARLVQSAVDAGAVFRQHRVRAVEDTGQEEVIDGAVRARVVVGADGAHSGVRPSRRPTGTTTALALRGYAPVPAGRRGEQVIAFGTRRQPSYAWSFDRGDGLANVGYGEVLSPGRGTPTRQGLLDRLEELLPGATEGGTSWRGHHLPLSGARWTHPPGRVLLAGDAAGLVNPLTGEGIYYAIATGLLAGRIAVSQHGDPGASYAREVRRLLGRHLKHTALAARLARGPVVLTSGMQAAAADQRVFDDLVELGLGRGRLTGTVVRALVASVVRPPGPDVPRPQPHTR